MMEFSCSSTKVSGFIYRYVHLIQTKYGSVGAAIAEELLHSGCQTASNVILKCMSNNEVNEKIEKIRDTFVTMVKDNYLIKLPMLVANEGDPDPVPKFNIEPYDLFFPPDVDIPMLLKIQSGAIPASQAKDACKLHKYSIFNCVLEYLIYISVYYWRINFNRFHQDFRDVLMVGAVERKLGASAAECFRYILKQMYERTDPWQKVSYKGI